MGHIMPHTTNTEVGIYQTIRVKFLVNIHYLISYCIHIMLHISIQNPEDV